MRFRRFSFLFLLPCFLAISAAAQIGVYGEFSSAKSDLGQLTETHNWLYGGLIGAYLDSNRLPVLEPGLDLRATFLDQTQSGDIVNDRLAGAFAGPRLAIHTRILPLRPYGEALIGATRTQGGGLNPTHASSPNQTNFAYQLILGGDFTVLPHIDWRVAEFTYTGIPSVTNDKLTTTAHTKVISTGLVFRF